MHKTFHFLSFNVFFCFTLEGRNRNARLVFQIMEASSTISNVSGNILVNQPRLEELPLFEFQVLATATDNFALTNKLGQGGFGLVYKVIC